MYLPHKTCYQCPSAYLDVHQPDFQLHQLNHFPTQMKLN